MGELSASRSLLPIQEHQFPHLNDIPYFSLSRRFTENKLFYILVQELSGFVDYDSAEPSACVKVQCGESAVRTKFFNNPYSCCEKK
jgi:hypothetical protein